MKTLWKISGIFLVVGILVFAYSFFPEVTKEPYTTTASQTNEYLLTNGLATTTAPSYNTYFDGIYNFTAGDTISITASSSDGKTPLSASISRYFRFETYASQENMTAISMNYTIPFSGRFEITVSRFQKNAFDFFSTETTANIHATARMTKQVQVQEYRDVTVYPHENMQIVGIGIMIAGIGLGVLTIAQGITKDRQLPYSAQSSPTVSIPTYQTTSIPSKFCSACGTELSPNERFCHNCGKSVS